MPIRYLCLSDLHLGEEDSLLTDASPSSPAPVLVGLAECLRALVTRCGCASPKPTLVLNGDTLELALSRTDEAVTVFTQFLSLIMPAGGELFDEIIYIPGNHDHHIWATAREVQYLNHLRKLPLDAAVDPPWHTTKVFMDMAGKDRLAHDFLTGLAQRFPHLRDRGFEILTAYPNYGVTREERCVLFHHGHFIEPVYRVMSTAMSLVFPEQPAPESVYDLEAENSAWIDFLWSTLGSCGRVGRDVEAIYETTSDRKSLQKLTDRLAASLARTYDLPLLEPDWTEEQVLKILLRREVVDRLAGRQERQKPPPEGDAPPLSPEARESLRWYLDDLVRKQIQQERGPAPRIAAFLFGHTHKPFEAVMDAPVFNTGGWVVDSPEPKPELGGAVAVIDGELNTVQIRMYNECREEIRVMEPREPHSALYHEVAEAVSAGGPWQAFGPAAAEAVRVRREKLRERIRRRHQE